jgi:hypothetical protein
VSTLHITNGDSAAGTLREFLDDPVAVTCDLLFEGPAPDVDLDTWHHLRAAYLSRIAPDGYETIRRSLTEGDRRIDEALAAERVVLWFEHDLYDQLLLVRTIARADPSADLWMICIGAFPGVERFIGLGQLSAGQLASLYPMRARVTAGQFKTASDVWRAFRAGDPRSLLSIGDTDPLPFVAAAIRRLFEEYPSTVNGLSRSAATALRLLKSAPIAAGRLFVATQQLEERPFLGDLGFYDILRSLAAARAPLVRIDDARAPDAPQAIVEITSAGRDVVEGRADAVALNGIDQWRGGVHLSAERRSPWRWDPQAQTLVS